MKWGRKHMDVTRARTAMIGIIASLPVLVLPVLLVIGEALLYIAGVVVAGGAVALAVDAIYQKLRGRRIAVLGERTVGKTTLIQFLRTGTVPEQYEQTMHAHKAKGRRIKLNELDLKLGDNVDVPGSKESYAKWQEVFKASDYSAYLIRIDQLLANNELYGARVSSDLKHIAAWMGESAGTVSRLCIVLTHCDLDPEYVNLKLDERGAYLDRLLRIPGVLEARRRAGGQKVPVIHGSMRGTEETERLVFDILRAWVGE